MEFKGSVANPQEPATGPYRQARRISIHNHTLFCLKIYLKIILPPTWWSSNYAFSRRPCLIHALASFFLGLPKNL
jgi:hypothetical protein